MSYLRTKLVLVAMLLSFAFPPIFAADFEVDGISYNVVSLSDLTCEVANGTYTGNITIPSSVAYKNRTFSVISIGASAFEGCSEITNVVIPQSVTKIKGCAFKDCVGLLNCEIPTSVIEIDSCAFYGCSNVTAIDISSECVSIGSYAFSGCSSLMECAIPNSVTNIGSGAFSGCTSLKNVTLPLNLTEIQEKLFSYCSSLEDILIPRRVVSIGENAFYGVGIKKISIPESVTYIGKYAFNNCDNLIEFSLEDSDNSIYIDRDDNNNNNLTGNNYLIYKGFVDTNLKTVYIGRNVQSMKNGYNGSHSGGLFYEQRKLDKVTFGKKVTYICSDDYNYCSCLNKIVIPSNVTYIGERAFANTGVNKVIIEDSAIPLTFFALIRKNYAQYPHCFEGTQIDTLYCGRNLVLETESSEMLWVTKKNQFFYGLKHLTFGNYCTQTDLIPVADYDLVELQFGSQLKTLPDLSTQSSLTKLSISSLTPPTVTEFTNAQYMNLEVRVPSGAKENYMSENVWKNFWDIEEDASLEYPMEYNGLLYEIISETEAKVIKNTNDYVGDIEVPSVVKLKGNDYSVISISEAFQNDKQLTSILLPSTINELENGSFAGCSILKEVKLLSNISAIPSECFNGCESLEDIKMPMSITSIEQKAFYGCKALKTLEFSDKVTAIGNYSFSGCSSLENLHLPTELGTIGNNAFEGCASLSLVTFNKGLTSIGNAAFKGCTNLNSMDLPSQLTCINDSVFYGTTNLQYVKMGNSVLAIGNHAFEKSGLTSIEFSSGLEVIKDSAFYGSSIVSVVLPDKLQEIGACAFRNCRLLEEISIPGSCILVKNDAFTNCCSLNQVTLNEGKENLTLGYREDYHLSNYITPYPNATTVDEKRTGFRNGYYDGMFYDLPITKLVINRNITNAKYYERQNGKPTYGYDNVYYDMIYYPPFYGLSKLKEVEIGKNVTAICQNTIETVVNAQSTTMQYTNFGKCNGIESVTSKNSKAPIGGGFTDTVYENATLYLPNGGEDSYKADDYWKKFLNILTTGISTIYNDENRNDGCIYDLLGRKHILPQKGINIINGKKVFVK